MGATQDNIETPLKTGLILSGGGARAAYQVGVLLGISEILPPGTRQPFPIICGTSAGAINALGLAGQAGQFRARTQALASLWASLESESIYRTRIWAVARNAAAILRAAASKRYARTHPLALLDNSPLRELLQEAVKFTHIDRALHRGELDAVAVTAINYNNGHTTTFYQGQDHIEPWLRANRVAERATLSVEHLLASSALPTLFPATQIGNDWYGDGALRQTRPLSAAIHLGADRLLIIGVKEMPKHGPDPQIKSTPPSIAQVTGQMMNAVFLDAMEADLETLERINTLVTSIENSPSNHSTAPLRNIDCLTISPSHSLSQIAAEHFRALPRSMRFFLKATGAIRENGSGGALSYIMFEKRYCEQLIELGFQDAMAKSDVIREFFHTDTERSGRRTERRHHPDGPVVRKPLAPLSRLWYRLTGQSRSRL